MYFKLLLKSVIAIFICYVNLYAQIDYQTQVSPIWINHGCLSCHGGSGGFYIDTYTHLMTTGTHKPLVVPGDVNSLLVQKLNGTASFGDRMPDIGSYLNSTEMATVIQWIKEGAKESISTGIENASNSKITKYSLNQNFPNPFNPSTIISYQIPNDNFVILKVYDITGKLITTLVARNQSAGSYSVSWNANGISNGVYYVRLQADNYTEVKKMVLLK